MQGGVGSPGYLNFSEPEPTIPHTVVTKTLRLIATKKREFMKMRKNLMVSQSILIENYAALKELETKIGVTPSSEENIGELRILSVSSWPAHDLLLLLRDKPTMPDEDIGQFGSQILSQLHAHLNPIPDEVLNMAAELMARRIDLVNMLRGKYRVDRHACNGEWKKSADYDIETEKLHRMVAGLAENLRSKLNHSLALARSAWLDRETLIKKIERLQKENLVLQNKVDEAKLDANQTPIQAVDGAYTNNQALSEELNKERVAREALKDVVTAAESMLRGARTRIVTLEKQLKDTKAELETSRKKHKDLEQLVKTLAIEHSPVKL